MNRMFPGRVVGDAAFRSGSRDVRIALD